MISLADSDLSPSYRLRLLDAVAALGERLLAPGETGGTTPRLVLAGLRAGERRLSPAVIAACDRWPDVPVLVACDEDLVQPITRLQGGRLTLVSQALAQQPLGQAIATCLAWTGPQEGVSPGADALPAEHEHWWSGVVVCGLPDAPHATLQHERCLHAWLRHGLATGVAASAIPCDALDAWSRRQVSADTRTTVSAAMHGEQSVEKSGERSGDMVAESRAMTGWCGAPVPSGCAAGVLLDPDGLALLHALGPQWQLIIASSQRLPAWCPLDGPQVLRTNRGDVLIAAWVADGTPVPPLSGSGRNIAQELGRRWAGLAATAVIVEVR